MLESLEKCGGAIGEVAKGFTTDLDFVQDVRGQEDILTWCMESTRNFSFILLMLWF